MKKQTAVEWLMENLHTAQMPFQQALQMEKEQKFNDFVAGQSSMEEGGKSFDQYYTETYGKE